MSAGVETGTLDLFGTAFAFGKVIFLGFFIGFAIKVPIFPFHTWLPDAHVEAPTAISVILAGVLLKMGTYGLLRVSYPILPEASRWFAPALAVLALINIVYGALCAMAQKDLKKLIAYSSISHMGFVLLGMSSGTVQGMNGAVLQMFNHGTITAMLFLLVGVLYDRAHHREIAGFGGLVSRMPVYGVFTSLAFFAAIGLPGLSGFISEALVLIGGFHAFPLLTILCSSGIVLGAAYMLWTYQRIFLGPLNTKYSDLPEIGGREIFTLAPLGAIVLVLGVYPQPILGMMGSSMGRLVQAVWG
jgi:NADH-quinone oxidoreductase subunit M